MTYLFQRFIRRYHRINIVVSGLSTIDNCEDKPKNSLLHVVFTNLLFKEVATIYLKTELSSSTILVSIVNCH